MASALAIFVRAASMLAICCSLFVAQAQAQSPAAPPGGMEAGMFAEGKRVALLIGQSDYRGAPLPSATADVAMMASQLSAAGFDVDSAGDLPEQGVAERVRGLVDRLTLKGADAVAFVYISGRFAQINGENVLLPVGVPIERASDAALNGFSMRKLISALETVSAKSRILILDAGPAPPALAGEPGVSPGLAMVEPPNGFLISYSQGPNRPLVDPPSQPGFYSRALFESILAPTAGVEDVFKNVRLRVHAETNGVQVPWEASKLKGLEFAFHENAAGPQAIRALDMSVETFASVKALPREEAYKGVVARDSIASYQAFIEAYPEDEAVPSMQYTLAVRREAEVWAHATRANSPDGYWTYLDTYPDGGNAFTARQRLAALGYAAAPPVGFAPVIYADIPPPLPGREIVASSASMPLEMAPRAPRLGIAPAPALVAGAAAAAAAAVAVPAIMNRGGGRQIPPVGQAAVRPSWTAPSGQGRPPSAAPLQQAPIAAQPAAAINPGLRPLTTQPLAQPPAASQPVARPLGGPTPAPAGAQPAGTAVRSLGAPNTPNNVAQPMRPIAGPAPTGAPAPGAGAAPFKAIPAAPQPQPKQQPAQTRQNAQQAARPAAAPQMMVRPQVQQPARAPARSCTPQQIKAGQCR